MHNQQPTHNKTTGSTEDKPVTTEITVNNESHIIDATHHIISDAGVVSLYLGSRSEGIDIQIINGTVLCRSDRARDRLNMHAGTDTHTVENEHTDTHADEQQLLTDGGRDIVEGTPDPGNAIDIGLTFDGDDWCVVFYEAADWSQNDLEPWIADRLNAPETVDEAEDDDRIFVNSKYGQADMRDVSFHDSVLAHGEFDDESGTWVVEVL